MYSSVQLSMDAVKSFPQAQFAWRVRKKHGSGELDENIVDGENDGRLLISQSGNLYIVGVRSEDTGTYTCVVSNSFVENDITIEFVLTVLEGGSSLRNIQTVPGFHFSCSPFGEREMPPLAPICVQTFNLFPVQTARTLFFPHPIHE